MQTFDFAKMLLSNSESKKSDRKAGFMPIGIECTDEQYLNSFMDFALSMWSFFEAVLLPAIGESNSEVKR